MFLIDFDDTLFNTRETDGFKQVRVEALQEIGISKKLYGNTYVEARDLGPVGYNDLKHAKVLAKHSGIAEELILTTLQDTTKPKLLKTFLYDDTIWFLEELKKLKQPMILLTFGDIQFQIIKAKRCGVDKYFDELAVVQEHKKIATGNLLEKYNSRPTWFVNNRVDETTEVQAEHPNLNYILKKTEDIDLQEYKQSGLPYYKTLTQIYEHIRNNQ